MNLPLTRTSRTPLTRSGITRRSLGLASLAATVTALAACSDAKPGATPSNQSAGTPGAPSESVVASQPAQSGSSTPAATSTKKAKVLTSLDEIKVAGARLKKPVVTGPWPLTAEKTLSKVLVEGKGATIDATSIVEVHYNGINARTGQTFDESFSRGAPTAFPLNQVVKGFAAGLTGKKVGDRVVILMPSKDGYADGNPQAGIEKGDALIFVVDIEGASVAKVSGEAQPAPAGMPTVQDNGDQAPTITIGDATKPKETTSAVLIKGTGRAVTEKDAVQVQYTAVNFDTGDVLAQTYSTGPETGPLNTLIPAWQKALKGKTVGSRVLVVSPPADAYPKGNEQPKIPAGATLVFVVDILFASASQ